MTAQAPVTHKVSICHNPPGNPGHYNYISVDTSSITKDHGHDQDSGDIIPAFEGYAGKNLTTYNVALLERECKAMVTTTTTQPESDPTTSTTLASSTTTRPTSSTTTTTLLSTPLLEDPTTTVGATPTTGPLPVPTILAANPSLPMLPVTGASPVLTGAGIALVLVGAIILKAVRA